MKKIKICPFCNYKSFNVEQNICVCCNTNLHNGILLLPCDIDVSFTYKDVIVLYEITDDIFFDKINGFIYIESNNLLVDLNKQNIIITVDSLIEISSDNILNKYKIVEKETIKVKESGSVDIKIRGISAYKECFLFENFREGMIIGYLIEEEIYFINNKGVYYIGEKDRVEIGDNLYYFDDKAYPLIGFEMCYLCRLKDRKILP